MKRMLLLLVAVLLLAGCGTQRGKNSADEEKKGENRTEQQAEQETENSENGSEDDPAEQEEKQPVEPMYRVNPVSSSIEPIGDAKKEVVLLTFDDAPDKYGVEIAKTLKELGVSAIFFVNGHFINSEEGRAKLKEIYDMGFPIGNHTYGHANLKTISEEKQRGEIVKLNDLIEEITGERPKFFRAPHGANTDFSRKVVQDEGMVLMNWTYGYDYFQPYMDAKKLTEAMVTGKGPEVGINYSLLRPGANLLMHDRQWTSEALVDIVKGLQEQGYEILDPALIETL